MGERNKLSPGKISRKRRNKRERRGKSFGLPPAPLLLGRDKPEKTFAGDSWQPLPLCPLLSVWSGRGTAWWVCGCNFRSCFQKKIFPTRIIQRQKKKRISASLVLVMMELAFLHSYHPLKSFQKPWLPPKESWEL